MPNASGIEPTEYKVLLRPKTVEEKTKGGIILPDDTKDKDQFAQMEAEIIAVSPLAFTYASESEQGWRGFEPPKVGDRVLFAKFSGAKVTGKDGKDYRIVNDKDICAVLS